MRKISMFLTILITSFVMAFAGLVASPIASASENGNGSISATFPLGSSVLTKSQKAAIKKVLASSGSDASFIVTGTAGKLPGLSDSRVQSLAKKRAQAIKAYLVSLGVSKTRVTTQTKTTEIGIIPTSTGSQPTSASTVAVTNSAGTGSGSSTGGGGTTATTISVAAIAGVTAPAVGATPVTTTTAGTGYTGTVTWSGSPATFASATIYTATITLTPTSGYTLTGVAANFFTVAGATSDTNSANSGVITAVFPAAATTISVAAIAGVTAPVIGATRVTTTTAGTGYTGTVTWSGSPTTFASATAYTATITLTPTSGYTLTGVAANFFTVAGATSDTNSANSGVITAVFPATATTISVAAIAGVTAPVTGATRVTTTTAGTEYTGTVTWSGSPAGTTFASATTYTATITLTPTSGYSLTGVAANFFTVAGATSVTNSANAGVITAVFPRTDITISVAAIAGVTAPVTGATPVTTTTAGAGYTGTVTWSGSPTTFASATAYTATITLTPTSGYTLTGVAADFFTVAGATSDTNSANSGVITAVFPVAPTTIAVAAIAGVTAPVTGATRVTTTTAGTEYTGTVTWSPSAGTTFLGGTTYTATITLTPTSGYSLTGVTDNFFTVAGATSDTNSANSGVITAVFPATDPIIISVAAIAGVTAPAVGATPVTTTTAGTGYTGTVTWSGSPTTFASATAYTATITLTPTSGYTLTGVAANFFTVAGATSVTNSANAGVITAVFPATATTISVAAIAGVTAPVTGATPVTTTTAGTGYTGTVTWSGSPTTFASATIYTATITLTPTSGYTLAGVTANFFTVAGVTSDTNSANSGVITAVFPRTATTISVAAIAGVTAPAVGATPVTTTTAGTGYTGTVTWSGSPTTFAAAIYTATITLTPTSGYTLAGVTADFFTVAGATSDTNSANSGVITAVFPEAAVTYVVGQVGPGGGIVFYVSGSYFTSTGSTCNTACEYLEVAPVNWAGTSATEDQHYKWSDDDTATTQVLSPSTESGFTDEQANWKIGKGFDNTRLMTNSAAKTAVGSYAGNVTAGQWFIPSMNELNELCKYARSQTTGVLTQRCENSGTLRSGFVSSVDVGSPFSQTYYLIYMSSSEESDSRAWAQSFIAGNSELFQKTETDPLSGGYVRPIRAF